MTPSRSAIRLLASNAASEASEGRSGASPTAVLAAVGFAMFVAADDLTVVTTMLRPMINDVGLTLPDGLDDAAWIVNVYLIAFVAVMPLAGKLSDVVGRRRLFMAAYAVFLVGTIVVPLSNSLTPLLVGRVLTALGGGAMVPVALAVVGDVFDQDRRSRALGTLGAIETLGWVWGPLYGAMLVRFLDWRWQFWLNIPLALVGMALAWWALSGEAGRPRRQGRVDWIGAALLATALIVLDLALLGDSEVQSVSGLSELRSGNGFKFVWLLPMAALLIGGFVVQQRRSNDPLIDPTFYSGRPLRSALAVNFVVGAALVIAMVDVPLFVNAIEIDLETAAVMAGWLLAALTASMALTSYLGGRLTERAGQKLPTLIGLAAAAIALLVMGLTWEPDINRWWAGTQLALLGGGLGLVFAPTTAAVVDASPPEQRGAAAAIVMVVRLIGLSVGLAALTAWGLARFNSARAGLELPAITDPGFQEAVLEATGQLTADAISETFLATAVFTLLGVLAAFGMRRTSSDRPPTFSSVQGESAMNKNQSNILFGSVVVLALGLIASLIWTASVASKASETEAELAAVEKELEQTKADLQRVEEGAAGSAIVAAQVLEISRQLTELQPTIEGGLDEAITELENFGSSTIEFEVPIDETIEINTEITIDRDFSFPIDESVRIQQTVDTTIQIDTPLGQVPVDVSVPVDVDVPIQLDVDVPINETVPVNADVPVKLDVPIEVDLTGTELETLVQRLAESLRTVQDLLGELSL